MELDLFVKMKIILKLLFSSFMSIEIVLFFLLLLLLLLVNLKIKNKMTSVIISLAFIIGVFVFSFFFSSYTIQCLDSFIIQVMNYYYFPSTIVYFFIFLFMLFVCIFTIWSKRMGLVKRVFNYCCSILTFLLFSIFIMLAVQGKIDMADTISLYKNRQILSVVQVSNLVVLFWAVISFFYYLYIFFRRKFDQEKVENI